MESAFGNSAKRPLAFWTIAMNKKTIFLAQQFHNIHYSILLPNEMATYSLRNRILAFSQFNKTEMNITYECKRTPNMWKRIVPQTIENLLKCKINTPVQYLSNFALGLKWLKFKINKIEKTTEKKTGRSKKKILEMYSGIEKTPIKNHYYESFE